MKILIMALALVVSAKAQAKSNDQATIDGLVKALAAQVKINQAMRECVPTKDIYSDTAGEGDIPDDSSEAHGDGFDAAVDMYQECLKNK